MKKDITFGFWVGFGAAASLHGTIQDWMGLERYLQWCADHWIEMSPWIHGSCFVGLVAIYQFVKFFSDED